MKIINSQIKFVKEEDSFLNSSTDETVIAVLDNTEVIYGADGSCNTQWCDENDVLYIHQDKLQGGGCIVGAKGNIFIDAKRKPNKGQCLSDMFSKALCNYFKNKGLESVRCDNNDVLIDGFKVASGCETTINGWQYMGYQIAINQEPEIIKHACNKPMVKVPKALSEYGITTEEMVQFCKEYWK